MPTRDALPELTITGAAKFSGQSHLSLAYEAWAPVGAEGKVPDKIPSDDRYRERWLEELTKLPVAVGYREAFARWSSSFRPPHDQLLEFTLASRLLLGHGNSSATEVGLTVHHTWGVPIITGTGLKGLCAHYTAAMYGPGTPSGKPWEHANEDDAERYRYQGVRWEETKIKAGPGDVYRALFGAPDAEDDEVWRRKGKQNGIVLWPAGAERGRVVFCDALYVPGSVTIGGQDRPFVEDVLTVHQKKYYDAGGKADRGQPERWPNDYDDPVPVAFLTVRPKARLLLALSGGEEETALAAYLLGQALQEWGVGGKTSLGYGRGTVGVWEGSGQ